MRRPPPLERSKLMQMPSRMPAVPVTESERHGETEDMRIVERHQLRGALIVGYRAKAAP
ncbi:MAG: hypothetical protein AAFQ58_02385 [Pseudomonadota bacterium]